MDIMFISTPIFSNLYHFFFDKHSETSTLAIRKYTPIIINNIYSLTEQRIILTNINFVPIDKYLSQAHTLPRLWWPG